MCVNPVAAILGGVSVGLNAYGASRQSGAALQAGQQQAMQSLIEAQIAEANARMAMIEASGRMGQVDQKVAGVIGQNRADAAARGLAVDQGSPLLDQAYIAAQGNIDKRLIGANAYMEAANQYERGAGAARQAGEALTAARYGAGAAWLGTLTSGVRTLGSLNWHSPAAGGASGGARFSADPSSWWS